ncbi:hypothetical protein L21SP5_03427 [Salinivirga cyanobacteriivorans]|uniref:STAS/SEC14 domain-containing protein n=1 Tax=Salinivirga cyanobacteriivorans TaxID=1307839 RepID=A0A0S2I3V4_9BACT|nr:hypothetical protein [Salinivirga cyanobacteriivorans]ALO17038.1 hypothetical protein L21SP5_03427 [Salinivirga cyanobacteriivorans]
MPQVYLNTAYCRIELDEDIKAVIIEWFGAPKSESFRSACLLVTKALKENGYSRVLTDNTNAVIFKREDQQWLNEVWLPEAEAAGYRASATIIKKDPFVRFAVDNIVKDRDNVKFLNQRFESREEARSWLKTLVL